MKPADVNSAINQFNEAPDRKGTIAATFCHKGRLFIVDMDGSLFLTTPDEGGWAFQLVTKL